LMVCLGGHQVSISHHLMLGQHAYVCASALSGILYITVTDAPIQSYVLADSAGKFR